MSPEVHIYDGSNDGSVFPSPVQEDMIKTTILELPMTPGRPLPPKKKKKKRNYPAPPRYQRPAPPQHTRTDPFPRPTFASNITPLMSFPPPIPESSSPPLLKGGHPPALTLSTSPPCKSPVTPPFYSPSETQPLLLPQPLLSEIASAAGHAEGVILGQQIAAEQQQLHEQRRRIPRIYWFLAWGIWAVFGLGIVVFWAKFWELSRAARRNH